MCQNTLFLFFRSKIFNIVVMFNLKISLLVGYILRISSQLRKILTKKQNPIIAQNLTLFVQYAAMENQKNLMKLFSVINVAKVCFFLFGYWRCFKP